uniref:Uncharacterized protein n=1 Tax=Cannabis sativa TaxID=3483 RepID=A0A803QRS9_CANSA
MASWWIRGFRKDGAMASCRLPAFFIPNVAISFYETSLIENFQWLCYCKISAGVACSYFEKLRLQEFYSFGSSQWSRLLAPEAIFFINQVTMGGFVFAILLHYIQR